MKPRSITILAAAMAIGAAHAADLTRLQSLLAQTPEGGWIKSSTSAFSSVFPTGADAAPASLGSYGTSTGAVIYAWSSMTIDPRSGDLWLTAGGGHANYAGNETYVNRGDSGNWQRGSLPSYVDVATNFVSGIAPQSAHQYDNTNWLTVNNKIISLGGATFNTGSDYATAAGRAGPYLFDPAKADPGKVGGGNGTGWNPSTPGGDMWENRRDRRTGAEVPSHVNGTSASTVVNGHDVVYFTADSQASGFPNLYSLTLGNAGESDVYAVAGVTRRTVAYKGTGTLDAQRSIYVRTASDNAGADLAAWNLASGTAVWDQPVYLTFANGTQFQVSGDFGIDYDSAHDLYVLWDGKAGGKTYYTKAVLDAAGVVQANWTVYEAPATTVDQPQGNFMTGVLGKFKYVDSLAAYMALDEMNAQGYADVWVYKPFSSVTAVPEPGAPLLMLAGLAMLTALRRHSAESTRRAK